jgi:hypothetical protein
MTVADNVKEYPEAATYAVWNRAKTTSVGDKISTGLGKLLTKAQTSYSLLEWHKLDAKRYQERFGEFTEHGRAHVAHETAKAHFRANMPKAIRDLENAKAKATELSKNVVISSKRKAAAKAAAAALAEPIRVLKAIHLRDFEAEEARLKA